MHCVCCQLYYHAVQLALFEYLRAVVISTIQLVFVMFEISRLCVFYKAHLTKHMLLMPVLQECCRM